MSYDELEKSVMKYQGQKIVMAAHPVSDSEESTLSQTHFSSTDSTNEAFTSAANSKGTSIHCFERFYFNEKINPEDFGDAPVRCGGILEKIETNPNRSKIWVLRLTVKNAFARKIS